MQLRDYQVEARDSVTEWFKKSTDPCLVEAPTGSGKSHIISSVAQWMRQVSPHKNVLCIAPSAELVEQNAEKYINYGFPASLFSSSAGEVSLKHPVVFGTPMTVKNRIHRFGDQWSALVIDEAHGVTPTLMSIYDHLKSNNPLLRTVGFTATPYRLDQGYIFTVNEHGSIIDPDGPERFFARKVYSVDARILIKRGWLTPPVIGSVDTDGYDRGLLEVGSTGEFTARSIDRAFVGHGRLTSKIIADIVAKSQNRGNVVIFATTVKHAKECMASLPPKLSRMVDGKTPKAERAEILRLFKRGDIKYLVNVGVLTTGFDAPNIGVVAILRPTESPALLVQMIGRGLRLMEGKLECLILDYAGNIEEHFPDGDLFNPDIEGTILSKSGKRIEVTCPSCGHTEMYMAAPNPDGLNWDKYGYFTDLTGSHIMFGDPDEEIPLPAHLGRRCVYVDVKGSRCDHRWMFKKCEECGGQNDIASTSCMHCDGEIVDPNSKLSVEEYVAGPVSGKSVEKVKEMHVEPHVSAAGNPCIKVTYVTERTAFTTYLQHKSHHNWLRAKYFEWSKATNGGRDIPYAISYRKTESGFYEVYKYYDS